MHPQRRSRFELSNLNDTIFHLNVRPCYTNSEILRYSSPRNVETIIHYRIFKINRFYRDIANIDVGILNFFFHPLERIFALCEWWKFPNHFPQLLRILVLQLIDVFSKLSLGIVLQISFSSILRAFSFE